MRTTTKTTPLTTAERHSTARARQARVLLAATGLFAVTVVPGVAVAQPAGPDDLTSAQPDDDPECQPFLVSCDPWITTDGGDDDGADDGNVDGGADDGGADDGGADDGGADDGGADDGGADGSDVDGGADGDGASDGGESSGGGEDIVPGRPTFTG